MSTLSFTTFRDIGAFEINQIRQDQPSCCNGIVRVRQYRVTVELVDEYLDVIIARLQKMFDETTNIHHRQSLIEEARKYNYDLFTRSYKE